ncbi:MAG: response regulator [Desulfobacteraceae bacterium]|jgi:DNA-binding response OmpR family regulator
MDVYAERMPNKAAHSPHVLLVEDEPGVANGLKMILSKVGYAVDISMTGLKALEVFRGNGFELVVADLRLPDIDGMDVIRVIKEERPETKVVVITGYPSVSSAVESAKLGVSDYLRKPFTDDDFMAAVREALEEREVDARERFLTETYEGRLIQKRDVIRVLDRTYEDQAFWRELMEKGSEVLEDYQLSSEAKAAIVSGDLKWINENVGELTQKQLKFILKRLEREAW